MRREVAASLEMLGTHTYVQETLIDAAEKGFRIREIASVWRPRRVGRSRVVASIPHYVFYTLPVLLLRSGQHIRWLYTLGLITIGVAFVLFAAVFIEEGLTLRLAHRMPALLLVAVLIISGLQLFFFGFVLQLLKQIKKSLDRQARVRLPLEPGAPAQAPHASHDERKRSA
jgi:VIT1/CCC1 family predicted Fe2+/Mn2+ transporter